MKSNIRLSFISDSGKFKTFTSLKKMKIFASDEKNSGTYYISYPNMTCKYSRAELIAL